MTQPVRIRLSRAHGWRLQEASRALNGLPAVNVARPSRWGNPYRVTPAVEAAGVRIPEVTAERAVELFRRRWEHALATWPSSRRALDEELRGRNLACWCAPGAPCHADVLLELANAPRCEAVP